VQLEQQASGQGDGAADSAPASPIRGIAGQIVANASLLAAVLVYMGWAYDTAFYGYFHINPLDLNIGIVEFMLVSLSLFSPAVVIAVAVLILASSTKPWTLEWKRPVRRTKPVSDGHGRPFSFRRPLNSTDSTGQPRARSGRLVRVGATLTVIALALALTARYVPDITYGVLGLLASGSLLLTWPTRADRYGRGLYVLAIMLAAVCVLWAGSLYATYLGKRSATEVVHDLSTRTAVTLYSTQPIGLAGPGVSVKTLPAGSIYHYRYEGLRLLTMRSGTYFLLPVRWNPRHDFTYIVSQSAETRIELS
jgi:hypothetical protein